MAVDNFEPYECYRDEKYAVRYACDFSEFSRIRHLNLNSNPLSGRNYNMQRFDSWMI